MRNNSSTIYSFLLLVGDFFALLAAFVVAYIFRVSIDSRPIANQISAVDYLQIFTLLIPIVLVIFAVLNLYSRPVYTSRVREFGRLIIGSFVGILTLIGYDFVSVSPIFPSKLVALYAFVLGFSLLIIERSILRLIRTILFGYGIGINKILIVGSGKSTNELINKISDTKHTGQKVVAVVGKESALIKKLEIPIYESIEKLHELDIDTVIQTGNLNDDQLTKEPTLRQR
jgi:FlaA1/EpsC-like NDP-sugar epimerase